MKRFLAISCIALVACSQGDAKQGKDAKDAKVAPPAVGVSVIEVALREVPVTFEAVGRTEGSREVRIDGMRCRSREHRHRARDGAGCNESPKAPEDSVPEPASAFGDFGASALLRWALLDLNQGPSDYESGALTTELRARGEED